MFKPPTPLAMDLRRQDRKKPSNGLRARGKTCLYRVLRNEPASTEDLAVSVGGMRDIDFTRPIYDPAKFWLFWIYASRIVMLLFRLFACLFLYRKTRTQMALDRKQTHLGKRPYLQMALPWNFFLFTLIATIASHCCVIVGHIPYIKVNSC